MFVPLLVPLPVNPVSELVPLFASEPLPERVMPFTLVGVMTPSVKLIAGVVVAVATVPLTPFAVVTETLVTVPLPDALSVVPLMLNPLPSEIETGNPVPPLLAWPSSFEAVRLRP